MKTGFYPRLALDGIRKNKQMYLPYLLTCILMVGIFYILLFLNQSPIVENMPAGNTTQVLMGLGTIVIGVFSVLFLFYTNAFLIRRRKKEFGLYNILGMNKHNIGAILFWESLLSGGLSLGLGLFFGVLLSKLAELCLARIVQGEVTFSFHISGNSLVIAAIFYAVIFLLIFLNALRQIRFSSASELVKSENFGEKPPKANWIFGLLGSVILAGAYYLAVSIQQPIEAIIWFFVAVIMVIIATYLLFIGGSVLVCRVLQKNKGYYYQKNHFVSVSSMVYRMKRNGAGLASICILATMVLVMIASSSSLYFGAESSLKNRYWREVGLRVDFLSVDSASEENIGSLRESVTQAVPETKNVSEHTLAYTYGVLEDGSFYPDPDSYYSLTSDYGSLTAVYFMDIHDYNRLTNQDISLSGQEALAFGYNLSKTPQKFQYKDLVFFLKKAPEIPDINRDYTAEVIPSLFLVVPDLEQAIHPFEADFAGNPELEIRTCWYYGFDTGLPTADTLEIQDQIYTVMRNISLKGNAPFYSCGVDCRGEASGDFYAMYGGLFFLGILLSIVFLVATVLIIYYKQISEGFEDQGRFAIMQKVGMTKEDIRKSINSQMTTVFFAPLLFAALHLSFALPLISKLLRLFALNNTSLLLLVSAGCVAAFGIFYAIVYKITSQVYYNLVSN